MDLDSILNNKKIVIVCGSGGVGKTTLSAALSVRAAQLGKKVLVLTIDPARRLATSLGVDELDDSERLVPGQSFPGELYAAMLDVKKTFDNFIIRLAPSPELADKVLRNELYRQVSTVLGGSQEFTSLEKLYVAYSSGKYDLVVLDTPPTKHAMDFLAAPSKIHTLFQENIIRWFVMPLAAIDRFSFGIMNRGTKMAFKLMERVVGSQFLSDLTEFFLAIKDWQSTLRERTAEVHRLLTSKECGFIVVTAFGAEKIIEAEVFSKQLKRGGYDLVGVIVNRVFPSWLTFRDEDAGNDLDSGARETFEKLKIYFEGLKKFYSRQLESFDAFQKNVEGTVLLLRVPDLEQDVHDLSSLTNVADLLMKGKS